MYNILNLSTGEYLTKKPFERRASAEFFFDWFTKDVITTKNYLYEIVIIEDKENETIA